jgi:hypothetical protein
LVRVVKLFSPLTLCITRTWIQKCNKFCIFAVNNEVCVVNNVQVISWFFLDQHLAALEITEVNNYNDELKYSSGMSTLMMEAVRTSETSVDNQFTRQYNPEYSSEHHTRAVRT